MSLVQLSCRRTSATTFERCSSQPPKCCSRNAPLIQMMGKVGSCCCHFNGEIRNFWRLRGGLLYRDPTVYGRNGDEPVGDLFIVNRLGHSKV